MPKSKVPQTITFYVPNAVNTDFVRVAIVDSVGLQVHVGQFLIRLYNNTSLFWLKGQGKKKLTFGESSRLRLFKYDPNYVMPPFESKLKK